MWPFTKKDKTSKEVEKFLKPGMCECGHIRSGHVNGRGKCASLASKSVCDELEVPFGHARCGCQIFIPRNNDDGGYIRIPVPSPDELAKLYER